jgi:acetyltransferase-like isoleucine patch superfamily enzyme
VGKVSATWPHQIKVGSKCILEDDIYFKYDGWWKPGPCIEVGDEVFIGRGCEFNIQERLRVGNDCLIASGCKFIDHDHGMSVDDGPMRTLPCPAAEINVEDDVWIGFNAVVLKGVTIGRGAVVAAGAVVNKSVPPYEIWGGIPARRIGSRFGKERGAAR